MLDTWEGYRTRRATRRRLGGIGLLCAVAGICAQSELRAAGSLDVGSTERPVRLQATGLDREPKRQKRATAEELEALRRATRETPRARKPRFDLIQALRTAGDLNAAHAEATAWREHDAYNLVVVRLLGDLESELGDRDRARRTYSAIVELLPKEVEARRALATVLKQAGDFATARSELLAAAQLSPSDARTSFELGDIEQRLGSFDSARQRFEAIQTAADAPESLRYPARQRLAQLHARALNAARKAGDQRQVTELTRAIAQLGIQGGVENDLKVFLSWDTDRTDVDLWVVTPSGEKVFFGHRQGKNGETLFDDVTTGYGPESFTAPRAQPGDYLIQVNYFGSRASSFNEARGEVTVVLNEGRADEARHVFPYRLFEATNTVSVARVRVEQKP